MMKNRQSVNAETTTLVFDLDNSDFDRLQEQICIVKYRIPAFRLPKRGNNWNENKREYAKMHDWYRSHCEFPYFVHPATASLYVGYPSKDAILDMHENGDFTIFDDFTNLGTVHFWLKVLMAGYFHKDAKFVSNNPFFLDVAQIPSKVPGREYRTVMQLTPSEHYQVNTSYHFEFFIQDRVTRLMKVDFSARDSRKIPYAYNLSKQGDFVFKQANVAEIKKQIQDGKTISIFEENTDEKYRSRLKFHSIESAERYEKTRCSKLRGFLSNFLAYLRDLGIQVQFKELTLVNPLLPVSRKTPKPSLHFEDFCVHVVDKRFRPSHCSLNSIMEALNNTCQAISLSGNITLTAESPANGDNILILMDYGKDDFEEHLQHKKDDDGYKHIKAGFPNSPSQGFCINTNYFKNNEEGWNEENYLTSYQPLKNNTLIKIPRVVDLPRNFQIALQQLFLKWLVAKSVYVQECLPHYDIIRDKVFISRQTALYIQDGTLMFESLNSPNINRVLQQRTGFGSFEEVALLRKEYDPYERKLPANVRLILSQENVWEIKELPERILYPDVSENLKNREKKYDKHRFQLPHIENELFTISRIEKYNAFIENEVAEQRISYEKLVEKEDEKKGTGKYRVLIFSILDITTETRLVKALRELADVPIKGKKEGGMLKIHEGVWFDEELCQYFVGARNGYKYSQDRGFQVRKIILHKGHFDKSVFFPLLDVEFVRHGGFTVQPYPFSLIKIHDDNLRS